MRRIFINHLKPAQYIGLSQTFSDDRGLKRRKLRIDYSGLCDIGTQRIELLPGLTTKKRPKEIVGIHVEQGRQISDYTGHLLDSLTNDINEKGSKVILLRERLMPQIDTFDRQVRSTLSLSKKQVPSIELNDHSLFLLAQIELFFYMTQATLDLLAKLSNVFNCKAPEKFGKQLYKTMTNQLTWDQGYQSFLRRQVELKEWLNSYRNIFAHTNSLKLRFTKIKGQWRSVIVKEFTDTEGLLLPDALEKLFNKFSRFCKFFDRHFAKKVRYLKKYAEGNNL